MRYGAKRAFRNLALGAFAALALAGAAQAQVTIAALGDSLTQGYGLPQEEGFVPQLEEWLRANGEEVTVINAGVSGDTTAGGLSRVGWTLTPEVDAMIVALGGNDLLRGIDPVASRRNLGGILSEATDSGVELMVVGLSAPGNYGPEYKEDFDAMYPELSRRYGAIYAESFLGALEAQEDRGSALAQYMQSDGIHPNADGVALIVEALGPQVLELVERAR